MPHCVQWIAHADWSVSPLKRHVCVARRDPDGVFALGAPTLVQQLGGAGQLIERLVGDFGGGGVLGMDVLVGLPQRYAQRAGIEAFLPWLDGLGQGAWASFYEVAPSVEDISLHRPFYPAKGGRVKMDDLVGALGLESRDDLRRACDFRPGRGTRWGTPLFWTMGAAQVGKATLSAWREVLAPARAHPSLNARIWPFEGALDELAGPDTVVLCEAFPTAYHAPLGLDLARGSKRAQGSRVEQAQALERWRGARGVRFDEALSHAIAQGFGPAANAEDAFDAVVGCAGMVDALVRPEPFFEPPGGMRQVEGWIFGMRDDRELEGPLLGEW